MTMNEILAWRQARFQALIEAEDLAAILFLTPARDGFDLYFTGESEKAYPPYDRALASMDTCVLLARGDKPTLIHASYLTEPGAPDPLLTHFGVENSDVGPYRWCVNHKAELYLHALTENHRLGIVNPHDLREELYAFVQRQVPGVEFIDITRQAHLLKAQKCEGDLSQEILAVQALDRVFARMSAIIRPEALESDVVNHIRKAASEVGQIGNYVSDWVIVDLKSATDGAPSVPGPLAWPGRRLQFGDRLQISVHAALHRAYSAACGRCFVIGTPQAETVQAWALAVQAQDAAAAALRPGATIADGVRAAQAAVYRPNSLVLPPANWIYGLGLSLAMAELPMAIPQWEDVPLQEGMILCLAPSIELPGRDPYCCMDTYVITRDGCRRLTKTDRAIKSLMAL